eukprot:gnl/Chilomastix_caulleri/2648.p1 GENE.gnl/Chilomastix_caulleri/2648~~gnl/Chilomastix_caulleri/2648.p1  ORF type:complete len:85 (+),score=20.04 gnl/Chilomastix_caulleri/2648:338-592(+)
MEGKMKSQRTRFVHPVLPVDVIHAANAFPWICPKLFVNNFYRRNMNVSPHVQIINSVDELNSCIFDFTEMEELKTIVDHWKSGG